MLEITLDVKGQKITLTVEETRKLKAELDTLFPPVMPSLAPWDSPAVKPIGWPYVVASVGDAA